MAPGMAAHLVPLRLHAAHQLRTGRRPLSHEKEGGTGSPLPQAVQKARGRLRLGSVVKGQCHIFRLLRQSFLPGTSLYGSLPIRASQHRQQAKPDHCQPTLSHPVASHSCM